MGCVTIKLKNPKHVDLNESINQSLEISLTLFKDRAKTIPWDISTFTGRGAISTSDRSLVVPFTMVIVAPNSITAKLTVEQVEANFIPNTPYIYDFGADQYSGPDIIYTLPLWEGTIIFEQRASRAL